MKKVFIIKTEADLKVSVSLEGQENVNTKLFLKIKSNYLLCTFLFSKIHTSFSPLYTYMQPWKMSHKCTGREKVSKSALLGSPVPSRYAHGIYGRN